MAIKTLKEDSILSILIASPPVNALSSTDLVEMHDLIEKSSFDDETSVIIIANEGKGFSAGADKKEHNFDNNKLEKINDYIWKVSNAIYNSDIPVICCCDGFVIGAGFFLPCSSDIVLATKDSYFQMPGINFDVLVGSAHLGRIIPKQRLREMVFTGEKILVDDIFSYGGISSIHVDREDMISRANKLAKKISSMERDSIKVLKKILNSNEPLDINNALKKEQQLTYQNKKNLLD
tara:strand:- start:1430 stop:2134 length:705 start_codon:yes stop_codon:yes gene_type:complete